MNEIPITTTDLREDLPNIADRLKDGDTFLLTRHGFHLAMLVPIDQYQSLIAYRDDHTDGA